MIFFDELNNLELFGAHIGNSYFESKTKKNGF